MKFSHYLLFSLVLAGQLVSCASEPKQDDSKSSQSASNELIAKKNGADEIQFFRKGETTPIVTQVAISDHRPYLHPIVAPDGDGQLTEYSPGHHKHQTGLYWGFTRLNGRDYFHHPEETHWRKIEATILDSLGKSVSWQTTYHLLNEDGNPILEEKQTWTLHENNSTFFLDLEWQGRAIEEVTIGEYDYGGLFLRMPWKEGIEGEVVNAARQINEEAEGQRANWVNVGMQVDGRSDLANVTIFDHPENAGFPQPWRVDGQLGVGPVRARMGDWHIHKGETETIQHRVICHTGAFQDNKILDYWKEYLGQDGFYTDAVLWGLAQEEGRNAKFLSPDEAVAAMTLPEDFQVNAWAAEPMITQPMAFCWDDRGRLWVAENRDYESRDDGFSNSGDSRILILEDTDRDGQADSRKVFLEGIPFPSAIAVGFDGLFLGAPPNLLFVPDQDGDDRADVDDIEVLLTGWGIRDRHETINSFHWGPDGWLYGLEGFATPSKIRKPINGGKIYRHREAFPEDLLDADGVDIDGGVWRYHPTKDIFEVVSHGFSNPWGIDYDAMGQLFITACVIPHMFHIIPGGIYQRQGGQHFNPYVYDDIKTIVDHRHRSAHGGARVYLSDAFPEEHHGRLFMANIHEHAVLSDILQPSRSGFTASHGDDFLKANNAQWIGFSMELGPAGDLFVLDWHDGDICGKEVLDKETGRIFRISPKNSLAQNWPDRYADLKTLSDLDLVRLQTSESAWHARRARVILQARATNDGLDPAAIEKLREIYDSKKTSDRLRALWSLHICNQADNALFKQALADKEEYVRAWAIQLMTEDKNASPELVDQLTEMATTDPSPVVRRYLAAALQRLPLDQRWSLASALAMRTEDVGDANIPKMIWFGLEPLVTADLPRALQLADKSGIPVLSNFITRRAAETENLDEILATLNPKSTNLPDQLTGFRDALRSKPDVTAPNTWAAISSSLGSSNEVSALVTEIGQLLGDEGSATTLMASLNRSNVPISEKRTAIRALGQKQWEALKPVLKKNIINSQLSSAALSAIANYQDEELAQHVVDNYFDIQADQRPIAVQALASNPVNGKILVDALKNDAIPRSEVPQYSARQLRRVVGNGFMEFWGPIDEPSDNKKKQYEEYSALLTTGALAGADADAGAVIFNKSCGNCHLLHGQGGQIGPDLTGANRTDIQYLLSNLIEPSSDIQDAYKMLVVTTRQGRTIVGNLAGETETIVQMRVVGEDQVVSIAKSDLQSRELMDVSLMPEGILGTLADEEVLDLVKFLQILEEPSSAID